MKDLGKNLLRLGFLLIILGFFMPVGCKSTGFSLSMGVIGKAKFGTSAMIFSPIDDIYGYMMFGIVIIALVGLVITFISNIKENYMISLICMAVCCVLMCIIMFKFNFYFNFKDFAFHNKYWPGKIDFGIGVYLMILGFISGVVSLIGKVILKKID